MKEKKISVFTTNENYNIIYHNHVYFISEGIVVHENGKNS